MAYTADIAELVERLETELQRAAWESSEDFSEPGMECRHLIRARRTLAELKAKLESGPVV